MSNEAPADDEVAAQVRAAVAGDFQPEHVNGFPMRPDVGSIDLVSYFLAYGFDSGFPSIPFLSLSLLSQGPIDVRSSRPPVKEDEVDRDKRPQSAEKQKSTKDSEKKEKKKKNLDRQSLEALGPSLGKGGSLRKNPPVRTTGEPAMTTATTPRGWRLVSTGSSRVCLAVMSTPRGRERQRRGQADLTAPALTRLPRLRQVGPPHTPNLPLHRRRVAGLSPRRRAVDPWPRRGLRKGGHWP